MATKLDMTKALEAQAWIEEVTGESFSSADFGDSLKNGVLLCKLLNSLQPGTVSKINTQNMAFKQMENIAAYIEGSKKLGVPDQYNFMTVDLYEQKKFRTSCIEYFDLEERERIWIQKEW